MYVRSSKRLISKQQQQAPFGVVAALHANVVTIALNVVELVNVDGIASVGNNVKQKHAGVIWSASDKCQQSRKQNYGHFPLNKQQDALALHIYMLIFYKSSHSDIYPYSSPDFFFLFFFIFSSYKLCPLYAFDQDTFNEANPPSQILQFEDEGIFLYSFS